MEQNELLQFFPVNLRMLIELDDVTDVMVNSNGSVFVDCGGMIKPAGFSCPSESLVMGIQNIARRLGMEFSALDPILDTRLPDGSRVAAVYRNGKVTLTIRKFNRWFTLDELVSAGCLTEEMKKYLLDAVASRKNILIAGATSSGKTTFGKALLDHIPDNERLLVIENPAELLLKQPCVEQWEATPGSARTAPITVAQFLVAALRHRPDRIILGEVREPAAAYELLQALNTGHSGSICTTHADSAEDAFHRMTDLVLAAHANVTHGFVERQILRSVEVIVHLQRVDGQRKVTAVAESTKDGFKTIFPEKGEN